MGFRPGIHPAINPVIRACGDREIVAARHGNIEVWLVIPGARGAEQIPVNERSRLIGRLLNRLPVIPRAGEMGRADGGEFQFQRRHEYAPLRQSADARWKRVHWWG